MRAMFGMVAATALATATVQAVDLSTKEANRIQDIFCGLCSERAAFTVARLRQSTELLYETDA